MTMWNRNAMSRWQQPRFNRISWYTFLRAAFPLALLNGYSCWASAQDERAIYLTHPVNVESAAPSETLGLILKSAHRPGGVATVLGCMDEPRNTMQFPDGTDLASALDLLASMQPQTAWATQNGVLNLLPKDGLPSVLSIRLERFTWDTSELLSHNIDLLFAQPAVRAHLAKSGAVAALRMHPGLQGAPRIIDGKPAPPKGEKVAVEDVTVLKALNSIVASYTNGFWMYEERVCGDEKTYYLAGY